MDETVPHGLAHLLGRRVAVVAALAAAISLHLLFRVWAIGQSYYYADDYLLLTDALTTSFTADYLLSPENGHLMPGARALYWLVAHLGGTDWTLAAVIAITLHLAASILAAWSFVVVFGGRWGVVVLYIVYATSAMTAQAFMWWVSSVNQSAIAIAFFAAIGSWVAYLRSRNLRWLAVSLLALVWGLLFFQKSLLILPVLAFLLAAYFTEGPLTHRLTVAIRRYWPAALAFGATAVVYVTYLMTQVPQPTSSATARWWDLFTTMVLSTFVTGVTGGPSGWIAKPGGAWANPPGWQLILSWALLLAVVSASLLTRRRAGRAWALLAGYLVVLVLLVGTSRAGVFGTEIAAAYRLQTDALYVALLAAGLAFMPIPGAHGSSTPRRREDFPAALLDKPLRLITALVAIGGLVNWVTWVDLWTKENTSQAYVARLTADLDRIGAQDLADRPVPTTIVSDLLGNANRLSLVAPLIAPQARFPEQSDRLAVVTSSGAVHHAMLDATVRSEPGPVPQCGWRVGARGRAIPMTGETRSEALWTRLGYLSSHGAVVRLETGGTAVEARINKGLGSLYLRLNDTGSSIRISGLPDDMTLCVGVVEVGRPVPGARL